MTCHLNPVQLKATASLSSTTNRETQFFFRVNLSIQYPKHRPFRTVLCHIGTYGGSGPRQLSSALSSRFKFPADLGKQNDRANPRFSNASFFLFLFPDLILKANCRASSCLSFRSNPKLSLLVAALAGWSLPWPYTLPASQTSTSSKLLPHSQHSASASMSSLLLSW
jgi:hypothetical protein